MRFKEFNGDWIKSRLSNYLVVSSLRNKNNTFTRNDVISVSGDLGCVNQIQLLGRSFAGVSLIPYHIVEFGDIVYTKSPLSEYPYGIIKTNRYQTGIVSTLYAVYKTNKNANNRFIEHYFGLKSHINNYLKPIVKIGAKHDMKVGNEEVLSNFVCFPDVIEQVKIANFIDLLDQRIDTQSKIIEDLELFKNMISYKVLYEDKTVCYKPLSSFSELKNGYAFKSNTYSSKGDYQIVTIANVTGNRYIDLTSSNKILNIPNDIQSHQILKINDILISLTGNVGRVSYCNKLNCLLNQRVGLLSIKNKDLIEYIFQCIHNKIFEKTMISRGQGVAQLNIGKYDVESFEIPVYSQDRMNTISEVLKLIDFKIIKEKDILELYKKQKAYLLKNMFI